MPVRKNCVVAYANVRGLPSNFVDLGALMAARRCDVLICAETLVSTRRHPAELRVTGYSYYGVTSVDSRPTARGTSVYVRQGYLCVRKSCFECGCHDVILLSIRAKHKIFMYLPCIATLVLKTLLDCLLTAMSEVQQTDRKSSFVSVGDFNAHHREVVLMVVLCWTLLPVVLARN